MTPRGLERSERQDENFQHGGWIYRMMSFHGLMNGYLVMVWIRMNYLVYLQWMNFKENGNTTTAWNVNPPSALPRLR